MQSFFYAMDGSIKRLHRCKKAAMFKIDGIIRLN